MAKKQPKPKREKQEDLFPDLHPPNVKAMKVTAEAYREADKARMEATKEAVRYKEKLIKLADEAEIPCDAKGKRKFSCDGYRITIEPKEAKMLVRVKTAAEIKAKKERKANQ